MDVTDINTNLDCFYVVKGAVEFTMREDMIHRINRQQEEDSMGMFESDDEDEPI